MNASRAPPGPIGNRQRSDEWNALPQAWTFSANDGNRVEFQHLISINSGGTSSPQIG
jgi:hypothetical protein